MNIFDIYKHSGVLEELREALATKCARVHLSGCAGSAMALMSSLLADEDPHRTHLHIATSKDDAYYLLNDIENLLSDNNEDIENKRVLFFPTTYRKPYQVEEVDNANVLQRSEVIKQLAAGRNLIIVTYPEALSEKVVSSKILTSNTLQVVQGTELSMDFIIEVLQEYEFERVDFVVEPGQYAVRGGIIDVFSYANDVPYRIEFFGDTIDSLRAFDPVSQLSVRRYEKLAIVPNLHTHATTTVEEKVSLLHYLCEDDTVWCQGVLYTVETIDKAFAVADAAYKKVSEASPVGHVGPKELYVSVQEFMQDMLRCRIVECGNSTYFTKTEHIKASIEPQPSTC